MSDNPIPQLIVATDVPNAWREIVRMVRRSETGALHNLMVHVVSPTRLIPPMLLAKESQIVDWAEELQSSEPRRLPFTHGQRMRKWSSSKKRTVTGGKIDQIGDFVIPILLRNSKTKRAFAVVSDPSLDARITDDPIPALMFVQFMLEGGELHLTAYFRAQEMYFFWVVNMFEMISLQEFVCKQLNALSPGKSVKAGSITTVAFTGYINPIDLGRKKASSSSTLAIERFEISRLRPKTLEQLLESAFINADSRSIRRITMLLSNDVQKLDRIRDIDYKGLESWQAFFSAHDQRISSRFRVMPEILNKTLRELVSLDMMLERNDHSDELKEQVESTRRVMNELIKYLKKKSVTASEPKD